MMWMRSLPEAGNLNFPARVQKLGRRRGECEGH